MPTTLDIPYSSSPDPLRQFDFYSPGGGDFSSLPLICFIHGGAWRSEDKQHHAELAQKLSSFTRFPVAVPNYRLSRQGDQDIRHPTHAEDILHFLEFLMSWEGPPGLERAYDPAKIILMGHSCSAHMLTSIFLDSSSITPTLTPSSKLLQSVLGIIMSEGIYDIDLLLSSFPNYLSWFIEEAFGQHASFASFSTCSFPLRTVSDIRWLIIHSKGDTLVDLPQSEKMLNHLRRLYDGNADRQIASSLNQLSGEHNAILKEEEYVEIAGDFILRVATGKDLQS